MLHEKNCGIDVLHCIVYFCNNYYLFCTYMYLLYTSKAVLILIINFVIVIVTHKCISLHPFFIIPIILKYYTPRIFATIFVVVTILLYFGNLKT